MLCPLQVALLAALGAAAGHVYLQLLIRDVDSLDPADGRVAPFLASADSQLSLRTIGCGIQLVCRPSGAYIAWAPNVLFLLFLWTCKLL